MKKNLTPHPKIDSSGVGVFLLLSELKSLCGLGDLCGKNVFKILPL
jgi:hypothetical protein